MSIGKYNTYNKYCLVNVKGEIIDKFRIISTALSMRSYYHKTYKELLYVKELNEDGTIKQKLDSSNNENKSLFNDTKDL